MNSRMEQNLGLPKTEISQSLLQLHKKVDTISTLWTTKTSHTNDTKHGNTTGKV